MIKDDQLLIEDWLNHFKNRHEPFWLIIAHKVLKQRTVLGQRIIKRGVKAYTIEPPPIIGTRQLLLSGKEGRILKERTYPPDGPINWNKYLPLLGQEIAPCELKTRVASQYIYN